MKSIKMTFIMNINIKLLKKIYIVSVFLSFSLCAMSDFELYIMEKGRIPYCNFFIKSFIKIIKQKNKKNIAV